MTPLQHYLFIDIETVSTQPRFDALTPAMQHLWSQKCNTIKTTPDADPGQLYEQRAGIFSEFAKVICIGLGCIVKKEDGWKIFLKMISGDDEKEVLASFTDASVAITSKSLISRSFAAGWW
jgi:3'-5' exonuclease